MPRDPRKSASRSGGLVVDFWFKKHRALTWLSKSFSFGPLLWKSLHTGKAASKEDEEERPETEEEAAAPAASASDAVPVFAEPGDWNEGEEEAAVDDDAVLDVI